MFDMNFEGIDGIRQSFIPRDCHHFSRSQAEPALRRTIRVLSCAPCRRIDWTMDQVDVDVEQQSPIMLMPVEINNDFNKAELENMFCRTAAKDELTRQSDPHTDRHLNFISLVHERKVVGN